MRRLCFFTLKRFLQLQLEKEKQSYDFENIETQLEKALGQASRVQKERETLQIETDRLREKYEKAQVGLLSPTSLTLFSLTGWFELYSLSILSGFPVLLLSTFSDLIKP